MNSEHEDVIRVMSQIHCARGPTRCAKCREASKKRMICLVRTYQDEGRVARPVIRLSRDGHSEYRVFDVVMNFDTEQEAREYARTHGISDIVLNRDET